MKISTVKFNADNCRSNASQCISQSTKVAKDNRPQMAIQRKLNQNIGNALQLTAQKKALSTIKVIQRIGEEEAILATTNMKRANHLQTLKDNNNLPAIQTQFFLANFFNELLEHIGKKSPDLVSENKCEILGYASVLLGFGTCGEFSMAVYNELMKSKNNKYVAICELQGYDEEDKEDDELQHTFILTLEHQISKGTLGKNQDLSAITVVDAWHGNKLMTLQQFIDGENHYGLQLTTDNVRVCECNQQTGVNKIKDIESDIRLFTERSLATMNILIEGSYAENSRFPKSNEIRKFMKENRDSEGNIIWYGVKDFVVPSHVNDIRRRNANNISRQNILPDFVLQ